ncbi:MAG: MMPL family transporter, partial [Polyangiaceae bacterium]|nr:MMPL family transporter [Polyangiaceae bacterium]
YLNSSTGFLVSIIAGNGINYGIMYMARYLEARRDEGLDVERAILAAHRDSWVPTLAGSTTAMLAYGSLILTDFRGFKHFGVISGYGMILCWLATYTLMPAALAASERVLPSFGEGARSAGPRLRYGLPFAWLARRYPRGIALAGALGCVVGAWAAARYLGGDPMEYNMRNIRNERRGRSAASLLNSEVDNLVGRMGQDGMAIMVDRLDQVPALEAELNRRRDAAPGGEKPFEKVVTIHALLPRDQERKLALLSEIRDRLERARKRGFLEEASWQKLTSHFPPGPLTPLGINDLPEEAARPFTEKDGTRGRIVYIVPATGSSVWDARYLMRWADSFRSTTLPGGETILGSGSAVIYADMIRTIGEDTPRAIAFSALGSVLVILLAFRFERAAWGVFLPWLMGISGLIAFLQLSSIKLNFLNFVALPITIGIGAEYAHNMMQRCRSEPPERLYHATVETGGAVILCSLTTTIGYLALTLSINQGIRSFGLAAAVGELTCVLAAVLVLPAALFRQNARGPSAARALSDPPR